MKSLLLTVLLLGLLVMPSVQAAEPAAELPELCSLLSLFSAHANSPDIVRLNWTLDKQSPTILSFRIYRGYEELGNFAVLAEVPVHGTSAMEYSYTDSTVRAGVSYYYKLAAVGQKSESVFPVVITATPPLAVGAEEPAELAPVAILKGDKIALYVRNGGHVKLAITLPAKTLVDDNLKPGIYEFDPPANARTGLKLRVEHEKGFKNDVIWPLP